MTVNLSTLLRAILCAITVSGPVASLSLPSNYGYGLYGSCAPIIQDYLKSSCASAATSDTPPVDAVSLALALQAQKGCIREEKLQFGPNKLPVDARIFNTLKKNYNPLVNLEGGLHALSKPIVELKPCCPRKSLAEEALESYLKEDPYQSNCGSNKPLLTYSDVGYVVEKPKCPNFVQGAPPVTCPTGQVVYTGQVPCLPGANSCCAYQPGNVFVVQKGSPKGACSSCC